MNYFLIPIVVVFIFALLSYIEQKFIIISSHNIFSHQIGSEFDGTSIVIIADLHSKTFGKNNEKLIKKIEGLSPDFIVIAGDLITKNKPCIPGNAYSLIKRLAQKYNIFYAYGNHEQNLCSKQDLYENHSQILYSNWKEYINKLNSLGVIILNNKCHIIKGKYSSIKITGVTLDREYFEHFNIPSIDKNYLDTLINYNPEQKSDDTITYDILIAHNPNFFDAYAEWGADLVLSGHMHGGLIRLPFIGGLLSPQVKLFPKYDSGIFHKDNHTMIVSRGLGSHSGMPRLLNRPEIINVRLTAKNKI